MNLLYICDEYPPGPNGGMGSMVQVLAREMARQGHRVFVAGLYTYRYGGQDYEEDQGVKVWRMRYGLQLPANGFWYKLQRKLPRPVRSRLNGRKAFDRFIHFIQALISSEQIDVIEVPDWNTFAYDIGFRVQWPAFPVPLIVKSHGSHTYFSQELHQVPIREWAETDRLLYQRADALSAVSHYTAGKNKVLFDTEKPITVLHNSIRVLPELPFDKRAEQQVVFSGTLTYKKGIFSLMKAWNIVAGQFPAATLSVYGKGDIKPLQALLEPGYLSSVQFMGHQPRELLFDALGTATLAVFPSYSETFGLAPVEAMSLGCPVIFTRYSCGPEIVHDGQTGLLADPDQPEDIAAAICRLLQDKALRRKLSKAGREDVLQRFDVQQSAVVHRQYYEQVILDFKHGRNG